MKTFFLSVVASLLLTATTQAQQKRATAISETPHFQKIHLEFGRVSRQCSGFGICRFTIDITIGELISLVNAFRSADGLVIQMPAEFYLRNKSKFQENALLLEEDFSLDPKTARAFGFETFVLKKGKYALVLDAKSNTYNCTFRM